MSYNGAGTLLLGGFLKCFGSPGGIAGLSGNTVCLREKNSDQTDVILDPS